MGREVTQPIKTIFNGVSRQPDTVRLPGQVEEGTNVLFSVVSGGFEKRPASQLVAALEGANPAVDYAIHAIDRDSTEQYIILVADGAVQAYDATTGEARTVLYEDATAQAYLTGTAADFAFVTVADYTFIVNKTVQVAMKPFVPAGGGTTGATAMAGADGTVHSNMTNPAFAFDGVESAALSSSAQLPNAAEGVTAYVGKNWGGKRRVVGFKVFKATDKLNFGGSSMKLQASNNGTDWVDLWTQAGPLTAASYESFDFDSQGFFQYHRILIIAAPSSLGNIILAEFPLNVAELVFYGAAQGVAGYAKTFATLPGTGSTGQVYVVTGGPSPLDTFYVTWNADELGWRETVSLGITNDFDATTMPHLLVRNGDGSFLFKRGAWAPRRVGDENTTKTPGFVGKTIQDVAFLRDHFCLIADEKVFFSQESEFFDLWPSKATQVLATDPIDKAASTNKVTLLKFAVPFRKSLFLMAEKAQFDVSSGDNPALTPESAVIDLATSYEAWPFCKPVAVSEQLYFTGKAQGDTVVWEYLYDDTAVSNIATDITKHCLGYIPGDPLQLAASAVDDTVFLLTTPGRNTVFVYKSYWQGNDKVMSSWASWGFGTGAWIYGIAVLGSYLYVVIRRGTAVYLEKVSTNTETPDATLGFAVLLDQRTKVTGTYNAGTNLTTWTLPYPHLNNVVAVLGGAFVQFGRALVLSYPTTTTVTATGDWTAGTVYFGVPYEADAELSKQYLRAEDDSAVISGRLQLYSVEFSFKTTGYFQVVVTPEARAAKTKEMTGRLLGSALNLIGAPVILPQGKFSAPIKSRAETTRIQIKSISHLPFVITSAVFKGEYFDKAKRG